MSNKGIIILVIIWMLFFFSLVFGRKYCKGNYMAMCRSYCRNHCINKE